MDKVDERQVSSDDAKKIEVPEWRKEMQETRAMKQARDSEHHHHELRVTHIQHDAILASPAILKRYANRAGLV